jgi:hypothetical protein
MNKCESISLAEKLKWTEKKWVCSIGYPSTGKSIKLDSRNVASRILKLIQKML